MEREDVGSAIAWLVGGTLLGAAVALLLAPESGRRTRTKIAKKAKRGRKNLVNSSQDIIARGRELYERGRELAEETAEIFERGRRVAEKKIEERL